MEGKKGWHSAEHLQDGGEEGNIALALATHSGVAWNQDISSIS